MKVWGFVYIYIYIYKLPMLNISCVSRPLNTIVLVQNITVFVLIETVFVLHLIGLKYDWNCPKYDGIGQRYDWISPPNMTGFILNLTVCDLSMTCLVTIMN